MVESSDKGQAKKGTSEVKTYPVPYDLIEIKDNITINFNTSYKASKEQIINQAIKFHLEGNIKEASKYYQYCLDQDFNDQRIFSNYGVILKNLGKLKEAELSYRKAIEIEPNSAKIHSNLGYIMRNLDKLKEAELSFRKSIKLNPNIAEFYLNLGLTLKDLGQLKEAE